MATLGLPARTPGIYSGVLDVLRKCAFLACVLRRIMGKRVSSLIWEERLQRNADY